ncbi:MAG: hypothetical protein J1E62_01380 [Lachnospiraceae bacterium]|nr:hypothetical protein [Lachnospiraceae bacterium]
MGKVFRKILEYTMLFCLVCGIGVLISGNTALAAEANIKGAKAAVLKAYKQYQTEVDVSAYNLINGRDSGAVVDMMTEIIAQTPDLFYAGQKFSKLVNASSNQIIKLELSYVKAFKTSSGKINTAKIKKTRSQIKSKVKKVLSQVSSNMTKLEKALVIHDYLVQNTSYYDGNEDYATSEWGVLLKGKGNCQGYSKAYAILLEKVGIPVKYADSIEMQHMWNVIKLNGKWYHVDVTWDDPVHPVTQKNQYGLVMHENFLCSTTNMKKRGYTGIRCSVKTSKKYDNKYWKKVNSGFAYRSGKWLFQTNSAIKQRTRIASGSSKTLSHAGGISFIKASKNKYYFINYNRVYLYNRKSNRVSLVLDGVIDYNKYNLTQLRYQKGELEIRMLRGSKTKIVVMHLNNK